MHPGCMVVLKFGTGMNGEQFVDELTLGSIGEMDQSCVNRWDSVVDSGAH